MEFPGWTEFQIRLLEMFMVWAGTGLHNHQRWAPHELHSRLPTSTRINTMENVVDVLIPFLLREGRIFVAPPPEGVSRSRRIDLVEYMINLENRQILQALDDSGYPQGDENVADENAKVSDLDDDDPEVGDHLSVSPGSPKQVAERSEEEMIRADPHYVERRKRVCHNNSS